MKRVLTVVLSLLAMLCGLAFWLSVDNEAMEPSRPVSDPVGQLRRGAYLARAGNCLGCHTARGGQPYAGGRELQTAFGSFFAPNLTPDIATGLGQWSGDDFWRALHFGKGRNGSPLYPAFPYPSYTKVSRDDADALFAYLRSLPAVAQPNRPHALRFPYNQRPLLRAWQALYFTPGVYQPVSNQSADWNRGAYLVQGLGHCAACHTSRNGLGASDSQADLAGGMLPVQNWYAPSLTSNTEAGLGNWQDKEITDLLHIGISARGSVFGPMADVVYDSLQHLSQQDVAAMAVYLKSLPQAGAPPEPEQIALPAHERDAMLVLGKRLYQHECMACHKAAGEGVPPSYPPLAGNQSLLMHSAVNPIRIVLNGGFPPGTQANPRPYGMPPYGPSMSDKEVAAVVSYIRTAWGNRAGMVAPAEVEKFRSAPVD